ncbi:hypothetical protein K488DRAFT_47667 [Vararia minispora EC-137]|uniref:Uncharacterized protein n=1 Tax=Vararia minispora EC-137 TaxID=1314806 RepID=A0ACB8QNM5_9AGAM|nr:hypothetical protein K488DRAFT_47667 [Vararia minispora EC-137]
MASADETPSPSSSRQPAVEYKKDGTVSRMRSHKGNIPQLPQTKLCPFCPAKFTRTTHLNRHLRNHTNERLYRCEACGSQFTRSDLLARHKKSCGDSRSRRRSCQACASLKVKCDLRQPCGKCKARSRECVYPAENLDDVHPGPSRSGPIGIANVDASAGFVPGQVSFPGDAQMAAFPELSLIEESSSTFAPPLSEANLSSFLQGSSDLRPSAMSLPTIGDADSTVLTAPSFFGIDHAFTSFVPSDIAAPSNAPGLSSFSNDMFEPFFRDVFNPGTSKASQSNGLSSTTSGDLAPSIVSPLNQSMQVDQPSFHSLFSGFDGLQNFDANAANGTDATQPMTGLDQDLILDMMAAGHQDPVPPSQSEPEGDLSKGMHPEIANINPGTARSTYTHDEILSVLQPPPPVPTDEAIPDPNETELQQYMQIFLTAFLPQIPIIHIPTLRVELKPPILIRSMQACGALFAKTKVADAFIERTLGSMRQNLVMEFAKPSDNPKHQMYIIMTLVLLQTIGLFHQSPRQRASSNLYHGMLVLMIRQNRVLDRSALWKTPTFPIPDTEALDAAWRDWTIHETIKRCMLLAYTHDQSHQIFFSLPASFAPNEFAIRLPCEEALWNAPNAFAWSQMLLADSPYGTIQQRLLGVPMMHGMAALGLEGGKMDSQDPFKDVGTMPPFAHFVLMHALLGELFRRCSPADSPANKPAGQEEEVHPHVFTMQLALHKWLKLWLLNPDAPLAAAPNGHVEGGAKAVTYTADPLPFYWLGQLLLLAFQEGLPPFSLEPPPFSPPASTSTASSPYSPYSPFDVAPSQSSASSRSQSSASPDPAIDPSHVPAKREDSRAAAFYAGPNYIPPGGPKKRMQTDAASAQFSLIKNWLQHIRSFLRRSEGSPTVVWDELMRIRLSGWYADTTMKACRRARQQQAGGTGSVTGFDEEDAEAHGLLGFFEEKLKI